MSPKRAASPVRSEAGAVDPPARGGASGPRPRDGDLSSGPGMSALEEEPINILIVDDEPKNLTVLETILDDADYRLVRAASAEEGLLALIADEFALLILDVHMPGMSGFELAQMIKKRRRTAHVPIIFLTAYFNEDQHVLEGYGTGAVDYLHKPVNPAVLRSKVSVFAELHRKNREVEAANRALLAEVANRRRIEDQLCDLNETLERRVTERTEALRENESRLRYAADAARLTYVEVDFPTRELRAADNFASVMGYAPPGRDADFALVTRVALRHVVPQDRRRVALAMREIAAGRRVDKFDYRIAGDDRIERWIESEWLVEIDGDGKPLKSFLTNLDVTARKAAQQQLRASEERFRQLADSMPQMVWTARGDGSFDYYNARWYEFTGFGADWLEDLAGWNPLLHPEDAKRCGDSWYRSLESGEACRIEFRLWDRISSNYCWYLGRALPVRNDEGRVVKWICTCTDIDEQKRSEEKLRRANNALEQFAFAASHDLQEPLRNIAIFSQMFQTRYGTNLNEEATMFLETIVEGATRMGRLVSDLLQYTQTAHGEPEPSASADGERALAQVIGDLDRAVRESHASITHDTLPPVGMKDVHVEQLLRNLIGNAIKYRRDEATPKVHVSAQQQGAFWHFTVQDNGIGIAPQYQQKIFGVFKRLHGAGEKYPGTGIGLAICQRIVDIYGGQLWVESEPGSGATFHFTVPCADGTPANSREVGLD